MILREKKPLKISEKKITNINILVYVQNNN